MLPKIKEEAICTYCGNKFLLRDAASKNSSQSIDNWLKLAQVAMDGDNSSEASEYYNKVLEVDPENPIAWFGKGISAGWSSTLANIKINEMIVGIEKALEFSTEDSKTIVIDNFISSGYAILYSIFNLTQNTLNKFMILDNSWGDYISRCSQIIDGINYLLRLVPDNIETAKLGVIITTRLINGVKYDTYNYRSRILSLTPESEQIQRSDDKEAKDKNI